MNQQPEQAIKYLCEDCNERNVSEELKIYIYERYQQSNPEDFAEGSHPKVCCQYCLALYGAVDDIISGAAHL